MSESLRLRPSSRAAGALVGAIVTAVGLACIAVYSGRELDLELLGIILLGGAGVWLLLSAIAAGLGGARRNRRRVSVAASSASANVTGPGPESGSDLRGSAREAAQTVSDKD
jgi:hypothetical protein